MNQVCILNGAGIYAMIAGMRELYTLYEYLYMDMVKSKVMWHRRATPTSSGIDQQCKGQVIIGSPILTNPN